MLQFTEGGFAQMIRNLKARDPEDRRFTYFTYNEMKDFLVSVSESVKHGRQVRDLQGLSEAEMHVMDRLEELSGTCNKFLVQHYCSNWREQDEKHDKKHQVELPGEQLLNAVAVILPLARIV